jgi:hypothetical protein
MQQGKISRGRQGRLHSCLAPLLQGGRAWRRRGRRRRDAQLPPLINLELSVMSAAQFHGGPPDAGSASAVEKLEACFLGSQGPLLPLHPERQCTVLKNR